MATTNAIVIQGTVQFPPDEGQPAVPVPFGLSSSYSSVVDSKLVMVGSGSQVVPFGTVGSPGAKAMLVEYEQQVGAPPVQLRINGGSDNLELSPGGFICLGSPAPAVGITSLTIVRTADATIRVRLFG